MRPATGAGPSSAQSRDMPHKNTTDYLAIIQQFSGRFSGRRFSRWRMKRANKKPKIKAGFWFHG